MSYIGQELRQGKIVRTLFTASGGETSVTVAYTPGQLSVFLNGVKLIEAVDYAATTGSSITGLSPALVVDDTIECISIDTLRQIDIALPAQSGQSGKFLTTNATTASWATVDALPTQSGQSGKFLTTDATNASWAALSQASILTQSMAGGNRNSLEVRGLDTSAGGGGTGITSLISTHYSFNSSGADGGGKLLLRRSRDTVYLNNDAVMANDCLGKVVFGGSDYTAWQEGPEIRGVAHQAWNSSSVQGSFLSFHTKDDGTSTLDERMRIDHNGKIGIGTDTPTVALHVVGDIYCTDISVADLKMSNERPGHPGNDIDGTHGSWTFQEGTENMYLINRKSGKHFKIVLEEIE
jgi:hypothetical protein